MKLKERELGRRWKLRRWCSRSIMRSASRARESLAKAKCPRTARVKSSTSMRQTCLRASGKRWISCSTISGGTAIVGFVKESTHADVIHVGAAPTARDFFAKVYQDAVNAKAE